MAQIPNSRVVVVTGAASGIGQAVAYRLAVDHYKVLAADVNYPVDTVAVIRAHAGDAIAVHLDVSDPQSWHNLEQVATSDNESIYGLVNVAGITNKASTDTAADLTEEAWNAIIDVNLKGTWLGMRAVLPSMISSGMGRIVNVASLAGLRGIPGCFSYAASKAGVMGMTRSAAADYGKAGVLVNAIAPGYIATPMTARAPASYEARGQDLLRAPFVGRAGTASEVASLVAYLLDEGSYISGQVIGIDGGWSSNGSP